MAVNTHRFVPLVKMKQKSPYIRYYYLVKWIADRHYPSMNDIIKLFEEKEITITDRTFYRDRKALIDGYNMPITYCNVNKGYFIDDANDAHHETNRFLQLMQEMITANSVSGLFSENTKYLTYLEFENQPSSIFHNVFEEVLTATQKKQKIKFRYQSYVKNKSEVYETKPLFLKQYQNRWYIIAEHNKTYKAFALERIEDLELTAKKFKADVDKVKQLFRNVVGLTNSDKQPVEKVVLRFHPSQKSYVQSVPIHRLQQQLADNETEFTIALLVKPNFELKQQVLKYGSLVEVLQPKTLRQEVKQEHQKALKLYKENR